MSLIETLLAIGLLSGVALIGMILSKKNMQLDMQQSSTKEVDSLILQMKSLLENPKNCLATLGGKSTSGAVFTQMKDALGNIYFETGKTYNHNLLERLFIIGPNPQTATWSTPGKVGYVNIGIKFERKTTSNEKVAFSKKIKLWVLADGSGNISNCSGTSFVANGLWRRSYENADNIFYQGGRVAIGPPDFSGLPAALAVAGPIQAQNDANEAFGLGNNPSGNYALSLGSAKPLQIKDNLSGQNAAIHGNSVKLTEELTVSPSPSPVPCNSTTIGSLRQQGNLNQWCGGSPVNWRNFANQ